MDPNTEAVRKLQKSLSLDWYSKKKNPFYSDIHTYIHTYVYIYIHTYIHTYITVVTVLYLKKCFNFF